MIERASNTAGRQLTRHFFTALFDFGILTEAGVDSYKRMLLHGVGGLCALGFILTRVYVKKYVALSLADSPEPYRHAVLGDDLMFIGLPMLAVAFVTVLISQSLFPDERDFRILGPLPVRKSVVFRAKLTALLLFTGAFTALVQASLLPLMLLTSVNRWREHNVMSRLVGLLAASASASLFAVLAVTAIVGIVVLASRGRSEALTSVLRSTLLGAMVMCLPLVLGTAPLEAAFVGRDVWIALVPPAWFVGLEHTFLGSADGMSIRLASIALAALTTAAAVVAIAYAVLFRHFERFMLCAPSVLLPSAGPAAVRDRESPAFRAIHRFTIVTLARSPMHQTVLLGLASVGVGLAINRFLGTVSGSASMVATALWAPFAIMFACGVALRSALALPNDHRANWIFRLTEDEATRGDQLRAVERIVTAWVVGVPLAAALPLMRLASGPGAVVALIVVALVGWVFVHVVLLGWRRIPFTCSYLPGKRFLTQSLVGGVASWILFTSLGVGLVRVARNSSTGAVVVIALLAVAALVLRKRRHSIWSHTPLMFDDEFPDELVRLRLV